MATWTRGDRMRIVALLDDWQVLDSTVDFSVLLGQFRPHGWPLEGMVMTFLFEQFQFFLYTAVTLVQSPPMQLFSKPS